ncbi:MAG TPA: hypothetical protein VJJ02_01455 [Candidatus Paceibacterota bacterium]
MPTGPWGVIGSKRPATLPFVPRPSARILDDGFPWSFLKTPLYQVLETIRELVETGSFKDQRIVRKPCSGYWGKERVMKLLNKTLREGVLSGFEDFCRSVGGFVCVGPNLIRLERQDQERKNRTGEWEALTYFSTPFTLFEAKMMHVELTKILRKATKGRCCEWMHIQLYWYPKIRIGSIPEVRIEVAERLCGQLSLAIAKAEHIAATKKKRK